METLISTSSAQLVEMSGINKFALLYGYTWMVLTLILIGVCIGKLSSRAKKVKQLK